MEKVVYKVGSIWTGRENWGGDLLRGSGIERERGGNCKMPLELNRPIWRSLRKVCMECRGDGSRLMVSIYQSTVIAR